MADKRKEGNKELSETTTTLIFVEGKGDRFVIQGLCEELKIQNFATWEVDTKSLKSFKKELKILQNETHYNNIEKIALICDADDDMDAAKKMLSNALLAQGFPAPASDEEFASNGIIKTGIFVMSGSSEEGALEDLFLETIEDDPKLACVTRYFNDVETQGSNLPTALSKAKVQAYLAVGTNHKDLVCTVGHAARPEYHYWNFEHPKLTPLKQFLRQL